MEWGNLFADVYPLIKIMEVQVCHEKIAIVIYGQHVFALSSIVCSQY